jgi:hypothetical protein
MAGLGSEGCGESPCGLDTQTASVPRDVSFPSALAFDGTERDFKLDDDGRYTAQHPVDARVFLILRTAAGSIRSARGLGQTVGSIEYIEERTIQADVRDRVRVALAEMVNDGLITIRRVDIDASVRGRIMFSVAYVNNLTQRKDTFRSS